MSRIGRTLVKKPSQVNVTYSGGKIRVVGPKGTLEVPLPEAIKLAQKDEVLLLENQDNSRRGRSLYGLSRALLANAVRGVTEGFKKELELSGVGYRAQVEGENLSLTIGFSHPVKFKAPSGIKFSVLENKIVVEGIDRQLVGEVTSQIRRLKPPEPYKGKGIKYVGEKIRRKAGKAAKAVGAVTK